MTPLQITRAYRRLARAAHPDVTGLADAATGGRFAAISDAYRRLRAAQAAADRATADRATADRAAADEAREAKPESTRPAVRDVVRPTADGGRAWAPRYAAAPLLRPGPPIVAGPVVVSPLPVPGGTPGGRRRAR